MRKKVQGWKSSSLYLAGKDVLIKDVAMAIPAYPMMCFKFPASLCKEINTDIARFWWANQEKDSGLQPCLTWKTVLGVDFWKAKKGHRGSWVWASLITGSVIHPTSSVTANLPQLVADIMDKDS
ncbi:unnamed protein product [Prunus armeniaca]